MPLPQPCEQAQEQVKVQVQHVRVVELFELLEFRPLRVRSAGGLVELRGRRASSLAQRETLRTNK
jgi:hypothetical protein